MRHLFYSFLLLFCAHLPLFAQKHDYIWIIGDNNKPRDTIRGGTTLDFNYSPGKIYYDYRTINMFQLNSSICDSSGRLVAYTNGCDIGGPGDSLLENGADINVGELHTEQCDDLDDGYVAGSQSSYMLPLAGTNQYGLIYKHSELIRNANGAVIDLYISELRYALIEQRRPPQRNRVTKKEITILHDSLSYGLMAAVKHANGRDWWIVVPRRRGNTFYVLGLSAAGFTDTIVQTIGLRRNPKGEGSGQMVFAPDGNKLYMTNTYDPVLVYDFDRSTGLFTGFSTIPFVYGEGLEAEIGCEISPNGRYLYLAARLSMWQFDLQAPDISASQTLVGKWVQQYVSAIPTIFVRLQLGPDCKIYGLGGGDTRYYHVIHNPDNAGTACNVHLNGIRLPTPSGASMPFFPNYRLGPLGDPGLPCSPVVSSGGAVVSPLPVVSVFPNPASDHVKITLNQAVSGALHWVLCDALGRTVRTLRLSAAESDWQQTDVADLAAGVYFWAVRGEDGRGVLTGKIMVQH